MELSPGQRPGGGRRSGDTGYCVCWDWSGPCRHPINSQQCAIVLGYSFAIPTRASAAAEARRIPPSVHLCSKRPPVIGAVSPRHPSLPATLGGGGSLRFIGQLSEERLLPPGPLAPVRLVDSFSGSAVSFDMSFKSFKDLGVSAERLGSFCKRWMARVQRSGSFFLPPFLPPSLPPSFPPLLSLAELYRLVLVLSANQALGFGFVLFFPLKIILFLSPAANHKRQKAEQ